MKLKILYSQRYFNDWHTGPLIYEWEDVFAELLNLEIVDSRKASVTTRRIDMALRFTSRLLFKNNKLIIWADLLVPKRNGLYFELLAGRSFYFTGSKNTVPVIIDYWKTIDRRLFYQAYRNCRAVLISNLQVYNFLKASNCPLNIYHFPFSIADKYKIDPNKPIEKKYEIIVPGRVDSVLLGFLQDYQKKFPNVECLLRKEVAGEFFYVSSQSGEVIRCQNREEYISLLRSSKIAFYSTVGIDGDEERTGGFSPLTPRFLEMVSAGCRIIARYRKNEDSDYYELSKICRSSDDYSTFEQELSNALNGKESPIDHYESYLKKHYTSARVNLLMEILSKIE